MCRRRVKYGRRVIAAVFACVEFKPIAAAGRFPDSVSVDREPRPEFRRAMEAADVELIVADRRA